MTCEQCGMDRKLIGGVCQDCTIARLMQIAVELDDRLERIEDMLVELVRQNG